MTAAAAAAVATAAVAAEGVAQDAGVGAVFGCCFAAMARAFWSSRSHDFCATAERNSVTFDDKKSEAERPDYGPIHFQFIETCYLIKKHKIMQKNQVFTIPKNDQENRVENPT